MRISSTQDLFLARPLSLGDESYEWKRVEARPHPSPLPQGEGEPLRTFPVNLRASRGVTHVCYSHPDRAPTWRVRMMKTRPTILPLLGERAGVRASVRNLPIIVLRNDTRRNFSYLKVNQFNTLGACRPLTSGMNSLPQHICNDTPVRKPCWLCSPR
jgi:hypothetical protein